MSDNDNFSPDGHRLPAGCDDAALESRIASLAPPLPMGLRQNVLAAVEQVLNASTETNCRGSLPDREPVWGVLAGACAVALTLSVVPWIAMPSSAVPRPVFSGPLQEFQDDRVADISQQRSQLLQSLASTETLPAPFQPGGQFQVESAAATTLRPRDLPKVLDGPL